MIIPLLVASIFIVSSAFAQDGWDRKRRVRNWGGNDDWSSSGLNFSPFGPVPPPPPAGFPGYGGNPFDPAANQGSGNIHAPVIWGGQRPLSSFGPGPWVPVPFPYGSQNAKNSYSASPWPGNSNFGQDASAGSGRWPGSMAGPGFGVGNWMDGSGNSGSGRGIGNSVGISGGSFTGNSGANFNGGISGGSFSGQAFDNNNSGNFFNGRGFGTGNSQMVRGNGQMGTENRPVGSFSGVSLTGSTIMLLSQSMPTGTVRLEGETNILPLLDVVVQPNGVLTIRSKPGVSYSSTFPIKAYASSNVLSHLHVEGSSEIRMATAMTGNSVTLTAMGSGKVGIPSLTVNSATVNAMGSGKIEIPAGRVETLTVDAQGSGEIQAFGLDAGRVSVKAAGSGRVQVTASKFLTAMASGSANVFYRGTAQLGPTLATGSSSISRAN